MSNTTLQQQKQVKTEAQMYGQLQQQENAFQASQIAQTRSTGQAAQPQLQTEKASSLSKKEKKAHKKMVKANTFVKPADLETSHMKKTLASSVEVEGQKMTQRELFEKVRQHDYTHMQNLDPVLRNRAATEYITAHPITVSPEQYIADLKQQYAAHPEQLTSAMMNPLLRMGISCMMNSPEVDQATKDKYRQIDALLNKEILIATLSKIPSADVEHGIGNADVVRSVQGQVFMIKMLAATQLGRLKKVVKEPPSSDDWSGPVANAFAHCSRVMFTLPGDREAGYKQRERLMHESFQLQAPFKSRAGATHSMSRKRKSATSKATEVKFFSPRSQYGMNVAVGGLGNDGIPDAEGHVRKLKNDGGCGHLYMHFEEGTESKHSGMLIGFESDAYKVMNQTGHVHDKKATGEFASSFGGQRCDEIGEKYGGRVVDLGGINVRKFTDFMGLINGVTTELFRKGTNGDPQAQQDLTELATMLSGDLMNATQFEAFVTKLYSLRGDDYAASSASTLLAGMCPQGWFN